MSFNTILLIIIIVLLSAGAYYLYYHKNNDNKIKRKKLNNNKKVKFNDNVEMNSEQSYDSLSLDSESVSSDLSLTPQWDENFVPLTDDNARQEIKEKIFASHKKMNHNRDDFDEFVNNRDDVDYGDDLKAQYGEKIGDVYDRMSQPIRAKKLNR